TRRRMHDRIAETLVRHERRIEILSITLEPEGEAADRVRITLRYRILMTQQTVTLGLSIGMEG
ncbi:MAG: GPW/gp25 family protein, partial [Pseudomonadota bacterium]